MKIRALRFIAWHAGVAAEQTGPALSHPCTICEEPLPSFTRGCSTTVPPRSAKACVQTSEPERSQKPTIRIRTSRCSRNHDATSFIAFLLSTLGSALSGPNSKTRLRKVARELRYSRLRNRARRPRARRLRTLLLSFALSSQRERLALPRVLVAVRELLVSPWHMRRHVQNAAKEKAPPPNQKLPSRFHRTATDPQNRTRKEHRDSLSCSVNAAPSSRRSNG